jgi:hypothetical protein
MVTALVAVPLLSATLSYAQANVFETFHWTSAEIKGQHHEKAAILLPITIPGVAATLYAQLDTGADATIFYGHVLREHGVPVDSGGTPDLQFRWFGLDSARGPLENPGFINWSMGSDVDLESDDPSEHIVGTVGLDKLIDRILILDFPRERYAVMADSSMADNLLPDSVDYVDATIYYNKFYVTVNLGDETVRAVRYDCGSSSATLILPLDWWQWATGLTGDEDAVIKDSIMSWGNYVTSWDAPAIHDLTFGAIRITAPHMTYIAWPDPSLASAKLMGNAPFYDNYVVIVDCIRERFGVCRGWQGVGNGE